MNCNSFSKVWTMIIIFVLIAGGILAYQYWGALKEEVELSGEEGGGQTGYGEEEIGYEVDPVTGWRILMDSGYGYEIKYPPEKVSFGMLGGRTAPKRYFDDVKFNIKAVSPIERGSEISPVTILADFDLCVYYPSFQEMKLSLDQFASQIAEGFKKESVQIADQPAIKLTFEKGFLIKGCWWISGGELIDVSENTEVIYLKHPDREIYLIFVIKYSSFDKADASKTFYDMFSTLKFKNVLSSEEDCSKITKGLEKDRCFRELAKSTRNENYCEKIETYIEVKDGCYQELAYFQNDYSLCEKIEAENYLTSCEEYFEEPPQNWETFINSQAGYKFDYPTGAEGATILEAGKEITLDLETQKTKRPGDISFSWKGRTYRISYSPNVEQVTLEDYIAQLETGYPKWEHLARYNKIIVGGETAYQHKRGFITYAFDGKNVYQLSGRGPTDPVYSRMLSSFEFLKPTSVITIISPKKGEKWAIGENNTIQWTSRLIPDIGGSYISLLTGDGSDMVGYIAGIISNNEPFTWDTKQLWYTRSGTGGSFEVEPGTYRIRIAIIDSQGRQIKGDSDSFYIVSME